MKQTEKLPAFQDANYLKELLRQAEELGLEKEDSEELQKRIKFLESQSSRTHTHDFFTQPTKEYPIHKVPTKEYDLRALNLLVGENG